VEYFEDLRNVNHCEFVQMTRDPDSGRYILKNELRTWSELQRERARRASIAEAGKPAAHIPIRKDWGQAVASVATKSNPTGSLDDIAAPDDVGPVEEDNEAFPKPADLDREVFSSPGGGADQHTGSTTSFQERLLFAKQTRELPNICETGRDFGGLSAAATPAGGDRGMNDYAFPSTGSLPQAGAVENLDSASGGASRADVLGDQEDLEAADDKQFEATKAADQSVEGSVY